MATNIQNLVAQIAQEEGVHPWWAQQIAANESGFDPRARSPKGAMGVMQLMPGTASGLGVQNPWNVEQNIRGGIRYWKSLAQQYGGDPILATAAYNAGPGAVDKYGGVPPYRETQQFVQNVTSGRGRGGGMAQGKQAREGTIIRDKKTGERFVFQGGQFVPYQAPAPPAVAAAAAPAQPQVNDFVTPVEQRRLTVPTPDQGLPWATQKMRGLGRGLAGAAGVVGRIAETPGIKQGLWLLDLPMKPVRAGLEKIQEKVMEPHRARTEAEFAQYLKDPGAGTAAPEAFAPMPSKEAFVTPIELGLMKSTYGLARKLGKKALQAPGAAKRFVTDPYALPGRKPLPAAAETVQTPTGAAPAVSNVSEAEDALNEALGLKGTETVAPVAAPSAAAATPAAPVTPWQVEAPERGIRQYPPSKGALPGGELPRVKYGRGFGRVSADPFHIPAKADAEKVADAARIVQMKMGLGRPDVNKIVEQIKNIQGEVSGFPWKRPLYDPFLDKMRKVGGG